MSQNMQRYTRLKKKINKFNMLLMCTLLKTNLLKKNQFQLFKQNKNLSNLT